MPVRRLGAEPGGQLKFIIMLYFQTPRNLSYFQTPRKRFSEFVVMQRRRSRRSAGNFRILIFLPRGEECRKARKKNGGHFLLISPLLEGNMLYLISILVVEYLDCQYRWKFRTTNPNLMRYFDIKFVLLLCTWFAFMGDCRTLNRVLVHNYCQYYKPSESKDLLRSRIV